MSKSNLSKPKDRRNLMVPRWAVPLVWGVIILVIQILLPWAISKIGPAYGWSQGTPSWWNLVGLMPVVSGIALYIWCLAFHFKSYTAPVQIGFSPPHLVVAGPYTISRNPMYLSALFAWLGWVIFYGSLAVLVALVILWSAFAFRVIPREERQLEGLFGNEYIEYKRSVQRWIGR